VKNQKPKLTKDRSLTIPNLRAIENCSNIFTKGHLHTFFILVAGFSMFAGLMIANQRTLDAAEVTKLQQVPSILSEPLKSQLLSRRSVLTQRLAALDLKFKTFDSGACNNGVEEGSAEYLYCLATFNRLSKQLSAYDSDAKKFNRRIIFKKRVALLSGGAFKIGNKIRAFARKSFTLVKGVSKVMIGVWHAERGSYQRARTLARFSELAEMEELLRSLEHEKRALLKKEILRTVISGDFDSRLFSRYPDKFSLTLLRAHMNLQSGNYDAALGQIAAARNMNIESPALADAAVYARQMKAVAMERQRPANPALIRHQENMAGAYAGWTLGMLLTDADMDATAVQVLTTSAQTLAREGNIDDAKTAFELTKSLSDGSGKNKVWLPSSGIYDGASEANILLDALEYGQHDWNKSLSFLRLAHKASPDNQRINEALAHAQALMASEVK